MKATELLTEQHQTLARLFKAFEVAETPLFENLRQVLAEVLEPNPIQARKLA